MRPDRLQLVRGRLLLDDDRHAAEALAEDVGEGVEGSNDERPNASSPGPPSGGPPSAPGGDQRIQDVAKPGDRSDRWPSSSNRWGIAVGMWLASHWPWVYGTIRSWRPCQT